MFILIGLVFWYAFYLLDTGTVVQSESGTCVPNSSEGLQRLFIPIMSMMGILLAMQGNAATVT